MSWLDVARSKIGAPYVWGAKGPDEFDCSGFVQWVEREGEGVRIPGFTDSIADATPQVVDEQPGDILLYRYADPGQPTVAYPHTEFSLGNGRVIGARWPNGVAEYPRLNHPFEVHRAASVAAAAPDPLAITPAGGVPTAGGGDLVAIAPPAWAWIAGGLAALWALDLL